LRKIATLIHYLNLEISFIVLLWAFIIKDLTDSKIPVLWYFVVTASIWVVYSIDHIIDGYKQNATEKDNRHRFIYDNRSKIIPILVFTTILAFSISLYIFPTQLIIYGFILVALSGIYLMIINFFKIPLKELFASFIFAVGIWFLPFFYSDNFHLQYILSFTLYFLLVFFNIIYLAIAEFDYDKKHQFNGMVHSIGLKSAKKLLIFLLILQTSIIGTLFYFQAPFKFMALVLLMLIAEIFILFYFEKLKKNDWHRQAADGVFILGCIYPLMKFLELIL
jgi:hypothetical protein